MEQRPGGPHGAAGGAVPHAEPVAQPAGGRGGWGGVVGPGGATGVHEGEFLAPVAFPAAQQPPQPQDPLGPNPIRQAGRVLGS